MPAVFTAKLDGSESIRRIHFPFSRLYLSIAEEHVAIAECATSAEASLRSSIVAVAFSTMAIEAIVNELSEDIIPFADLDDFSRLKRAYSDKRNSGESKVLRKLRILAERRGSRLTEDLIGPLERTVSLRNELVHYRLSDAALEVKLTEPIERKEQADGAVVMTFDLSQSAKVSKAPLIDSLTPATARQAVESVHAVRTFLQT